jgi:excinuclease ABC subunit C
LVRSQAADTVGPQLFGPYATSAIARQMFDLAVRLFQIRQCSDEDFHRRKSPCLLYQLHRCSAPCVGKVSKKEYEQQIKSASSILSGKVFSFRKKFEKMMREASRRLEFERAEQFLQIVKMLESVGKSRERERREVDVVGVWEEGKWGALSILHYQGPILVYGETKAFSCSSGFHFSETVEQLLIQHYTQRAKEEGFPKKILLSSGEFSVEALSACLQELCGKKVDIKNPSCTFGRDGAQLGFKSSGDREKVSLAVENARAKISQHFDLKKSKKSILESIQQRFCLSKRPSIIDCFDASHCSGDDGVAACVSFVEGEKCTKRYRTFIIREKVGDDLSMLHEAVLRRYRDKNFPDLILIDGGENQLKAVQKALKKLCAPIVDLISISKEKGKHTRGMTREKFFVVGSKEPILLSHTSSELHFIQSVRDEAHRFVIQFHRKRRRGSFLSSQLLEIKGIGPKKRQKLLSSFRGIRELQNASLQEIEERAGLSKKDARKIVTFFKNSKLRLITS